MGSWISAEIFQEMPVHRGTGSQGGALVAPAYPGRAARFEKPGPSTGLSRGRVAFLFLDGFMRVNVERCRGAPCPGAAVMAQRLGVPGLESAMTSP